MENPDNSPDFKDFVKKIVMVEVGLLIIASVIALSINLYVSIVLFGLGILSTVVGGYLGGSNPFDPRNSRMSYVYPYEDPSAEKLRARMMHVVKNSVPFYSIENALFIAGLIALLLSLPFICQIMF